MVKFRPGRSYRRIKRAYTRKSRFKKKSYIKAVPPKKVVRMDMGNGTGNYDYQIDFVSLYNFQVLDHAIEATRTYLVKHLEEKIGLTNFYLKIRKFPHHVIRENKMITGAGADRMQTGMSLAFGKPTGTAVQIRKGEIIMSLRVYADKIDLAKYLMAKANTKMPLTWKVDTKKIK